MSYLMDIDGYHHILSFSDFPQRMKEAVNETCVCLLIDSDNKCTGICTLLFKKRHKSPNIAIA